MAGREPAAALLMRARHRCANAERKVTVVQAELSREIVAPRPGPRRDQLIQLLQEHIAERDAAVRALNELLQKPRWQLEQLAAETA